MHRSSKYFFIKNFSPYNRFRQHPHGRADRIFLGDYDMKRNTKAILLALIMGTVIPSVLIQMAQGMLKNRNASAEESLQTIQTDSQQVTKECNKVIFIPVLFEDGTVENMEIETYISGVVLAEMPADFEKEALKAQAVVARTYALKRYFGAEKHNQNAVCTDPGCCQAYSDREDFLSSGGTQIALDNVFDAVTQTSGMVLTYQSQLIDATYFSCSGGKTEDALAVWGADVPYLQSVVSPGEENAAHYMDTVFFSLQEFSDCLQIDKVLLVGDWIGEITYTNGGGVASISICNQEYSGTQIRSLLGLRSTAFVMTAVGNTVTVTTKGFGHRVGMSQYGADAMAVSGSSYNEILAYYYQGTTLEEFVI